MAVFILNTDTENTAVHLPIKTKIVSLVFFFSLLSDSGILWTHRKTEISLLARNNIRKIYWLYLLLRTDKLSFLKHNSDVQKIGYHWVWGFLFPLFFKGKNNDSPILNFNLQIQPVELKQIFNTQLYCEKYCFLCVYNLKKTLQDRKNNQNLDFCKCHFPHIQKKCKSFPIPNVLTTK